MNNNKKWTYRLGIDVRWMHDDYKTKDEAIREGIKEAKKRNAKEVFIGKKVQDVMPVIDVREVIDNIQDDMYEAYGEVSYGYLDDVKNEQAMDLGKKLNAVLKEWLKNNNLEPDFYHIITIEKIEVGNEQLYGGKEKKKTYKYILIVSQYWHSYYMFAVKAPEDDKIIEKMQQCTIELDKYKGGGVNSDHVLKKISDPFYDYKENKIRSRYNVNGNGDIYFIMMNTIQGLMDQQKYYLDECTQMSKGDKKKTLLEDISNNHSYGKVKEIVTKYFEMA